MVTSCPLDFAARAWIPFPQTLSLQTPASSPVLPTSPAFDPHNTLAVSPRPLPLPSNYETDDAASDFFAIVTSSAPISPSPRISTTNMKSGPRPSLTASPSSSHPLTELTPFSDIHKSRKYTTEPATPSNVTALFRSRRNIQRHPYAFELHDFLKVVPDDPFGPHVGLKLPATLTSLTAVVNPYFKPLHPLPSSETVFRSEL